MATDPSKQSQCSRILAYLEQGNSLTPMEALKRFGTMRLGARVKDLRDLGHPIATEIITVTTADGSKARVAKYWLERSGSVNETAVL